ncbi:MAG: excinuclease ABC subunit UvrC [Breznakibacter sp.]
MNESLFPLISLLPELPGVYQYFDKNGQILYVGKAKNLKRRVSSYFNREHENGKTRVLVNKISDIRHIVVDTEEDALLLENNLIKKYQPKYNVLLKDDKTYPWIAIKKEPFPRVFQTRNLVRDGSLYFGPYTSGLVVKTLLELFRQLYPLRTCSLNLSEENILKGKYKVCLEYHLGNCKGPCVKEYDEGAYLSHIEDIKSILKGNINSVHKFMKEIMMNYAHEFKFEQAEEIKQKIKVLENFQSKSTIVNPSINNVDVFSIVDDEKSAYVNFLKVSNGAIIQAHTIEYRKRLDESSQEILTLAISEIRDRFHSTSREIIVPFMPEIEFRGVVLSIPKIGDKKKLLDLSERNVTFYRLEKLRQQSIAKRETNEERILNTLMKDLRLKNLPVHIECFDNSNIQGTNPVAACVVFRNGKASKKDYRHFNVKTVEGPDDFASMREIVSRRYKRLLDEKQTLPQLIIIDGGKGQLGAAVEALTNLNLYEIPVIGIAKRLEEIFFPGDPVPLYLDKNSESLKLIQQLRNEAHRFGITFHRQKRSSNFLKSELEDISGVGENTIQKLMAHFKTVSKIRAASEEEIAHVIGASKSRLLVDYFKVNS